MNRLPTPCCLAKGDHLARALVAQVPDLPSFAGAHLAPGGPQPARPSRARRTALALPRQLSQGHVVPPFQGADTPPRHHQRCTRVGGDGGLMDLAQVDGGLRRSGAVAAGLTGTETCSS